MAITHFMILAVAAAISVTASISEAVTPASKQYIATITQDDYTGVYQDTGNRRSPPTTEARFLRRSRLISDVRFVSPTEVVIQYHQSDAYGKVPSIYEMQETPSDTLVLTFKTPEVAGAFALNLMTSQTQNIVVIDETKGVQTHDTFYRTVFAGGGSMWDAAAKKPADIPGLAEMPKPDSSVMSSIKGLFNQL